MPHVMSLEEMIEADPLPATESPPPLPASHRRLPPLSEPELELIPLSELEPRGEEASDPHRPPWLEGQFFPPLALHTMRGSGVVEQPSKEWPWCTIGVLWYSWGGAHPHCGGGTGVLVGRDLVLTASHVVPWHAPAPWSMTFIPAYREPPTGGIDPRFGSASVLTCRGVIVGTDVSGFDCAICRLDTPLGDRCGWMGIRSFGDEDDYYDRTWTSVGYPQNFANATRPAARFEVGVRDIDSEGRALEVETVNFVSYGWSGGPLWAFLDGGPRVIGVASGLEQDGLDPQRSVFAAGTHMVDLVKTPF